MNNKTTKEEIDHIKGLCAEHYIRNYTINNDGTIDVVGNVDFSGKNLEHLPLKFNKIEGNFLCFDNKLTTLMGAPKTVTGVVSFSNNNLKSLKYCPTVIGGLIWYINNYFPQIFKDTMASLSRAERKTFHNYQHYYDVWTPVFSEENMEGLVEDIKGGLQ
jgi:hypothetical protein